MLSPFNSKMMLPLSLAFSCLLVVPSALAKTKSQGAKPSLSAKAPMPSKHAANKAAWCHAVVDQEFPDNQIGGTIGGKPFKPDVVQWNSYSITLKQSKKRYCKVVINMMKSQKPLCKIAFTSDSNDRPHIYVYSRSSNSGPVVEQHYTSNDRYGLKFALLAIKPDDSVPGSLSLRLPDGSFVAGQFAAEKAPRVIWDDQAVTP